MAGAYAPAIMDEMVMKAWKDQWALLKPFLFGIDRHLSACIVR